MYRIDKSVKSDPQRRWNLPDRVFFAAGACHILAHTLIERHPDFRPVWIKPAHGFTGNHVVAVKGDLAFDYHGWTPWLRLLEHTRRKADRWWPGWSCSLVELPVDVLTSEEKSRQYDGLWLREPGQFLHDPLPRARRFVDRLGAPASLPKAPHPTGF